ncbi:MAG TPA: NHL repeat-containing protein [Candidatus Rifleibacterium sp.]|nr:NHL repeat-containing protein [Candidatus Rifleibacterium sp.]HPT45543.1 NHL repeat-containing protein [Candidatus Rifleibacterium sp.]
MNKPITFAAVLALVFSLAGPLFSQPDTEKMWVKLAIASDSADFKFHLPIDGCVTILSTVAGRKQVDPLWGPGSMKAGTYKISIPAGKVNGRSGIVELFNITMTPESETGSRGNGERQFNNPMGIDFDSSRSEILVADTGNDRIIRLSDKGRQVSVHGGFGLSFGDRSEEREDSLDEPYDVAAGGFSNFYVSDQNNRRACIFDAYRSYRGNLFPKDDNRRNQLDRPRGIKVDFESNIWLVDGRADKVMKISANGERLFEVGGFGFSLLHLKDPTQVDVNQHGEIFIADRGKGRIAIFDRLGSFIGEMVDHLKTPTGVAVDPDGLILVCDDSTNEMGLYTPKGVRLTCIDRASDGSGLRRPSDIAVTEKYIFLLDSGNHRIIHIRRQKQSTAVPWQAENTVLK